MPFNFYNQPVDNKYKKKLLLWQKENANISSQHCDKKKIADRRKELAEGEQVEESVGILILSCTRVGSNLNPVTSSSSLKLVMMWVNGNQQILCSFPKAG